jgi:hypothetical protein
MSEERMGDQNNKTEDRYASREQERDTFREADRERIDWNNVAARLERLRPLRDQFAAELAAEQVVNMQNVSPLHALSAEQLDAPIESMANVLVRARVEKFERRIEQLELSHAIALGKIADLRAAQPTEPIGAHPYRSARPAKAPSSPVTASTASERVEGRPWREGAANGQRVRFACSLVLLAASAVFAALHFGRGNDAVAIGTMLCALPPMLVSLSERRRTVRSLP